MTTPTDDAAGLAACPFCQGLATVREVLVAFEDRQWWVGCEACHVFFQYKSEGRERAIAAWNRRPTTPAPAEGNERESLLAVAHDWNRNWLDEWLSERQHEALVDAVLVWLRARLAQPPAEKGKP